MTRILLVEDDDYLASALVLALERKKYLVDLAKTGSQALQSLFSERYDAVLLDLGLPVVDGIEILDELRKQNEELPVIIITARDRVEDKIKGLDKGASDYLVKPFDFGELEARLRAALRKSNFTNSTQIKFASLSLDTNNGQLQLPAESMELTPKEVVVLKTLMTRAGKVVSKRQLMDQIPDWLLESSENAVEIVVHRLRKKLEASDVNINTVRGFGYILEPRQL